MTCPTCGGKELRQRLGGPDLVCGKCQNADDTGREAKNMDSLEADIKRLDLSTASEAVALASKYAEQIRGMSRRSVVVGIAAERMAEALRDTRNMPTEPGLGANVIISRILLNCDYALREYEAAVGSSDGVGVIRLFHGEGIRVWGTKT